MNDDCILGLDALTTPAPSDRFWSNLHEQLVGSAAQSLAGPLVAGADLVDVFDRDRPNSGHRRIRLVAAAAAIVLIIAGLTTYSLGRPDTLAPADRGNGVITDPTTIDLDPWRPADYMQQADVGGPYEVFDLTRLPIGWQTDPRLTTPTGTDSVAPDNPVDWSWSAVLDAPNGVTWVLFVQATRQGTSPNVEGIGDRVKVRGTDGLVVADERTLRWAERDVLIEVRWPETEQAEDALALANALVPTAVDDLTQPPATGERMSEPQPPLLAGMIDGVEWWVDTRPTALTNAESTLSLIVGGAIQGSGGGPVPVTGFGDVGLPGRGRVHFGRTTADLGSIRVVLADQTTVILPVAREDTDTTVFAVPLPFGLDIVSIDYLASDGHILRSHRRVPLTDVAGMTWSEDSL